MKSPAVFLFVLFLSISATAQEPTSPQDYNIDDAYQVYSVLLPREESFRRAKGTLVIQQETVPLCQKDSEPCGPNQAQRPQRCVTEEAAKTFKDAIADFDRVNGKRWVLQRRFEIDKHYELVPEPSIRDFFRGLGCDWHQFYEHYPDSGGIIILSAVGFNSDKTQAIVYSGSGYSCAGGSWSLHLFKKIDGSWHEVSGTHCLSVA